MLCYAAKRSTALGCLCFGSALITALNLPSSSIFNILPSVSNSVCSLRRTRSLVIDVVDLPCHPPYLNLHTFFLPIFLSPVSPSSPLPSPPQLSSPHPSTSPLSRQVLALHERFLDTCLKQCLLASQVCHCVCMCTCVRVHVLSFYTPIFFHHSSFSPFSHTFRSITPHSYHYPFSLSGPLEDPH
jgi:hypothetical protein